MREKKILIVDDDPEILESLEKKLVAQDFNVITANSGKSAVKNARQNLPDLILLDIVMPDMDGADVIGALKKDPQLADVPILLLTGVITDNEASNDQFTIKVGGHQFHALSKPFQFEELLDKLREII